MKKEIKIIDQPAGMFRVTTLDERWYGRQTIDEKTGLPVIEWRPSMSWIASKYPKGLGYMMWLAKHSWDEAQAIKEDRAESGSKVHQACDLIAKGTDVKHDDKFINSETGMAEELTPDEFEKVLNYRQWWDTLAPRKPKVLCSEMVVWADEYAGSIDQIIELDNEEDPSKRDIVVVDLKTSQDIFDSHMIQLDGYFNAPLFLPIDQTRPEPVFIKPTHQAILQLGYRRNKHGYKYTLIEGAGPKREIAYKIWKLDHGEDQPKQRDLPLVIKGIKADETKSTDPAAETGGEAAPSKTKGRPTKAKAN